METLRNLIVLSVRKGLSSRQQTRKTNRITATQVKQELRCVFEKLVVSRPCNRSYTLCFSQAVPRRVEGAPAALEQEGQQRRDRAPAWCWELKKLHTNRPTGRGRVQDSRGPERRLGETAGGGFGLGLQGQGDISPEVRQMGEMSHHLQEGWPERRPGSWGKSESRELGVLKAPGSRSEKAGR